MSEHDSITAATEARTATRLPRTARTTVWILFAAWCIDYLDRQALAIALPFITEDFALSATAGGVLLSAFGIAYAVSQIPAGLLADRFGAKRLASFSLLAWSVFTALTALTWNFASIFVVRLLFGSAQAAYPNASMKAISEVTTRRQRMTANGIVLSSNAVGIVVASLAVPLMISLVGWRWMFVASALLGVLLFALVAKWLPGPAKARAARAEAGDPEEDPVADRRGSNTLLLSPWMWVYAGMHFGSGIIVYGLISWMPTYLVAARGVDLAGASILLAIPAVASAVGYVISGRLSDRLGGRPRLVVAPIMVVCIVVLILMSNSANLMLFILWETIAAFLVGLCTSSYFAVPLKSVRAAYAATASSIVNTGAQVAGIVIPIVIGLIVDRSGFTLAFVALAAGAVIAAACALIAPQTVDQFAGRLRDRSVIA